ncbi:uncharacterized protein PHALS_04588 [Plasmopara halstedii]|uniref:Uncharacterized protein n=1 Tax=Plasmopara halstedii TaxID=4781 RepID=A0A0P1A9V3_PLAHL|nr:uncharacterized protein PHALS_04588 [Plasmopara halstedii]CEG37136.1 hypothetical protein PHALS_04588 [Plasmopara halstedii]|eukprot:XP_024573505.1 hypothetical protein PHALS_04588 [Plasmopara halstedii]
MAQSSVPATLLQVEIWPGCPGRPGAIVKRQADDPIITDLKFIQDKSDGILGLPK